MAEVVNLSMDRFPTQRDINQIKPAPENEAVYHAIAWDDPAIHELSKDIKEHGLIEPILISTDGFIISGHRRRVAAALAGLTQVPVKIHPISRAEDPERFVKLLVAMNSQRIKSTSDLLHETLVKIDPKEAHQADRQPAPRESRTCRVEPVGD